MTADELDNLIAANWVSKVKPRDTVWHLGDIGRDWRRLEELPGTKHLVLAHASDRRPAIAKSGIFASIQEQAWIEFKGRSFFLVHNPDQPRAGPGENVIHGHHHYDRPAAGHIAVCVDHTGWGPMAIGELVFNGSPMAGALE